MIIYKEGYWNDVKKVLANIKGLETLRNKRVMITGCTGMVCSTLVDSLVWLNRTEHMNIHMILAGRDKKKIDNRFKKILDDNNYEFCKFDANNDLDINVSADYIIHGASNANPIAYTTAPVETLLGNVIGVNDILKLAKKNEGCRVLFISSSEVYGIKSKDELLPYSEEDYGFVDVLNPRACYPNGKRAAENLCACYIKEHNIDVVIVRLGHIYGPSIQDNDTRASASFTRDVKNGRNIIMKSAGNQIRSYCYTLDCASGMITVMLKGNTGESYNISNKNSVVTIRDVASELAKQGGVNVIFENPSDVEKSGYNMMINSSLRSDKIEALGWKAFFDLEDGIRNTLEYYI